MPVAKKAKQAKKGETLTYKHRLIKGLAHPLRARILERLNEREFSPRQLENQFNVGLSKVSYHVQRLLEYRLIELTRTEPRRGAVEHFYVAVVPAFIPSEMAKELPASGLRIVANDTLKNIDQDAATSLRSGRFFARPHWHVSWTPLDLDGIAAEKAEKLADEFVRGYLGLGEETDDRRSKGESDGEHIRTSAALMIFGSEEGTAERSWPQRQASKGKPRAKKPRAKKRRK